MNKYSYEHNEYIKGIKKEKRLILLVRVTVILIFIIIWELLSRFNIINTFLYSSPSRIINTIVLLGYKDLLIHICITLYEVIISFLITIIIGIFISFILWYNPLLSKIVDPFITIINSLPKVALGPLFIIWIGASTKSIIFMALTISIFTTIINIYQYFISINDNYIIMLKSFGASKIQIFKYIVFPSNINNIISTLKINISLCLIGVIMGELLVSKRGIGYLIMYGSQVFQLDLVISSIIILGFISYVLYLIVDVISNYYNRIH